MRKSSSFMCVLVVLLAGGAEAARPLPVDKLFGLVALGFASVEAWETCQTFDQIYANGEELCEVMWNNAFEYTTDEDNAYTFWWFEGGAAGEADTISNPNNEVATLLGLTPPDLNDQCGLVYYHKTHVSPEPASFTECHPWHSASCCSESTVMTPTAINTGYGEGFRWDRCGKLSPACERFFVMEACFYECEPTAGLYRKYSDAQFAACNPAYSYAGNLGAGTQVTLADGSTYTCDGSENQWQIWHMPIKASVCDSWYRACAEDSFCGGGNYFDCANAYHDEEGGYRAALEANATAAQALAEELQDEVEGLNEDVDKLEKKADELPPWAIGVIAASAGLVVVCLLTVCILLTREAAGKPVFKPTGAPDATSTASAGDKL